VGVGCVVGILSPDAVGSTTFQVAMSFYKNIVFFRDFPVITANYLITNGISVTLKYKFVRNFCGTWYLLHSHVHNERTVLIIMAGCMAHARNGHISTSGLKYKVTIVFLVKTK